MTLDAQLKASIFVSNPIRAAANLGELCDRYRRFHATTAKSRIKLCSYQLAWLAEERGDVAAAHVALDAIPPDGEPQVLVAHTYRMLFAGQLDQAIHDARTAVARLRGEWWTTIYAIDALIVAAQAQVALARPSDAIATLQQALTLIDSLVAVESGADLPRRLARIRGQLAILELARDPGTTRRPRRSKRSRTPQLDRVRTDQVHAALILRIAVRALRQRRALPLNRVGNRIPKALGSRRRHIHIEARGSEACGSGAGPASLDGGIDVRVPERHPAAIIAPDQRFPWRGECGAVPAVVADDHLQHRLALQRRGHVAIALRRLGVPGQCELRDRVSGTSDIKPRRLDRWADTLGHRVDPITLEYDRSPRSHPECVFLTTRRLACRVPADRLWASPDERHPLQVVGLEPGNIVLCDTR
ncbi:MAG: hypothetical protein E6J91_31545 [Deltaproteobacteria bacterium]|nr:MAG: hypothetical protein E6J91_31545 [Deltaproteobacteria bacterium]